jgi:hypothetical protein
MPQICDMGQTALLSLQRKACRGFESITSASFSVCVHIPTGPVEITVHLYVYNNSATEQNYLTLSVRTEYIYSTASYASHPDRVRDFHEVVK